MTSASELIQTSAGPRPGPGPAAAATGRTCAAGNGRSPAGGWADTASEAADFLGQLQAERGEQGPAHERLREVRGQIEATGTYWQTQDELTRGAKLAWRNTPQCIGKFYWKGLTVRDMR